VTNYMVKSWNPAPAPAGFALQIRQNPAPAGFLKSKSGTALVIPQIFALNRHPSVLLCQNWLWCWSMCVKISRQHATNPTDYLPMVCNLNMHLLCALGCFIHWIKLLMLI